MQNDVTTLMTAVGSDDLAYQEIGEREQQEAAARRWRLLDATDRALQSRRRSEPAWAVAPRVVSDLVTDLVSAKPGNGEEVA